eukprot:GDKJ01020291.1.p1 GENE.GDKJ01020291.1~~GDKJ01020291.1.p1  ORF type:complete len:325 (-),score=64.32 GDKJ01020291.1:86-1060(-)
MLKSHNRHVDLSVLSSCPELNFAIIADPQIGMYREVEDAKRFGDCLRVLGKYDVDFAIIVGDLIQTPYSTDLDMCNRQIGLLRNAVELNHEKKIPLLAIAGNHDIGDSPKDANVTFYEKNFGDCFFSFECKNHRFICLETSILVESSEASEYIQKQFEWLDELARKASSSNVNSPLFVFSHHPLFIDSMDEGDEMGRVDLDLRDRRILVPQAYFRVRKEQRKLLVERLKKIANGGKIHVFSGHMHLNHGVEDDAFTQIVTTSCTFQLGNGSRDGFRIVQVPDVSSISPSSEVVVQHRFIPLEGEEGEWVNGGRPTGEELPRIYE